MSGEPALLAGLAWLLYWAGSAYAMFPYKIFVVFLWEGGLAEIPVVHAEISANRPTHLLI